MLLHLKQKVKSNEVGLVQLPGRGAFVASPTPEHYGCCKVDATRAVTSQSGQSATGSKWKGKVCSQSGPALERSGDLGAYAPPSYLAMCPVHRVWPLSQRSHPSLLSPPPAPLASVLEVIV